MLAIMVGILVWHVFPIGNPALQGAVDASSATGITSQEVTVSLKDTITGIIPQDIVSPFLNSNMLQIIFISVLIGIAAGVLSIGAPGVPGAALVCLSILLPQVGVPSEAISLVMGKYSLVGMILVCTNVTGDAAVTLITAKHEKLLDTNVYNSFKHRAAQQNGKA